MSKRICKGTELRNGILRGVEKAATLLEKAYGPSGGPVLLERVAGTLASRDGVTLIRELSFEDPLETLGCRVLREACLALDERGDGTTTTAILARSLLFEMNKLVVAGYDPPILCRYVRVLCDSLSDELEKLVFRVESEEDIADLCRVASGGDEEISRILAEVTMDLGKGGEIVVVDGQGVFCEVDLRDGTVIKCGFVSERFAPNGHERWMDQPLVAVVSGALVKVKDVQSMMEVASQWPDNHLLVIADRIEGDALRTLILNEVKRNVRCCAITPPSFGRHRSGYLEDLAALAGATLIDARVGMSSERWEAEWFGSFRTAQIKGGESIFTTYDEEPEGLDEHLVRLRVAASKTEYDYDRDEYLRRAANLRSSMCLLKVGGVTEASRKERRARVEDALASLRLSLDGGLVPGGGKVYLLLADRLRNESCETEEERLVRQCLQKALQGPSKALLSNIGIEAAPALEALRGAASGSLYGMWVGWDMVEGRIRDLSESPRVADPFLVCRGALQAAVSVVERLLMSEAGVYG